MDDKEKYLSEKLNKERTDEQAHACYVKVQEKLNKSKIKTKVIRRRIIACVASFVVVCLAVMLPLLLKKEDVRYFDENLDFISSTQELLDENFEKLNLEVPFLGEEAVLSYQLCRPKEEEVIVGGRISFECLTSSNYYDGVITIYNGSVVFNSNSYPSLQQTLTSDSIIYKYALIGMDEDMYNYQAYATTDKFTIIIKYRAVFDEFTDFIDQLYS